MLSERTRPVVMAVAALFPILACGRELSRGEPEVPSTPAPARSVPSASASEASSAISGPCQGVWLERLGRCEKVPDERERGRDALAWWPNILVTGYDAKDQEAALAAVARIEQECLGYAPRAYPIDGASIVLASRQGVGPTVSEDGGLEPVFVACVASRLASGFKDTDRTRTVRARFVSGVNRGGTLVSDSQTRETISGQPRKVGYPWTHSMLQGLMESLGAQYLECFRQALPPGVPNGDLSIEVSASISFTMGTQDEVKDVRVSETKGFESAALKRLEECLGRQTLLAPLSTAKGRFGGRFGFRETELQYDMLFLRVAPNARISF